MKIYITSSLEKVYWNVGGTPKVSETNPFVIEYWGTEKLYDHPLRTEPNWALIIPLAVLLLAVLITVCVILYRKWRRDNCYPIYFAGKTKLVRRGQSLACYNDWIRARKNDIGYQGHYIVGLFTDPKLSQPLSMNHIVTAPLYIFPKLKP